MLMQGLRALVGFEKRGTGVPVDVRGFMSDVSDFRAG